jgi:hypothetical protein
LLFFGFNPAPEHLGNASGPGNAAAGRKRRLAVKYFAD